ncbi:MAG: precorrin-6y C5,15-methyltransferase (decarboxylating) subunit CbiE [Rhodospirillales bacterium]|nr:precorrin-6y C5,15-methyltransferase (decarboxylating) subunit CbiE [Rhodospirillales bacterium]
MTTPWITVVGIGEDGASELTSSAKAAIDTAELLVGGDRHHVLAPRSDVKLLTWDAGLRETFEEISKWRGKRVTILASGDPLCFGVASTMLKKYFLPEDMTVIPTPSSFSLACSRLRWSLPDTTCLTIHGRPLEAVGVHLVPKGRLVILSRDGDSPSEVAKFLTKKGFGESKVTVLEHMGGPLENRLGGTAESWAFGRTADLNVIAVELIAGPAAKYLSCLPGLPDEAFENDGQLTKREVRAATISALQPLPGDVFWDVGAGSGSIAIEWLRAVKGVGQAVAFEKNADRVAAITRNANALGVPKLEIIHGNAPRALREGGKRPDAIFVGGGVSNKELMETCWASLNQGGRFVANAVTIEAEARLFEFAKEVGGELNRISVSRLENVGSLSGFKPLMTVTQVVAVKK